MKALMMHFLSGDDLWIDRAYVTFKTDRLRELEIYGRQDG
jgi:hypothetical protein